MNTVEKVLMCRRRLASSPELWQDGILEPKKLVAFVRDRGVKIFNEETIKRLWQVRLLRADLVKSGYPIKRPVLDCIGIDEEGFYVYLDNRKAALRKKATAELSQSGGYERISVFTSILFVFTFYTM